MAKHDKHRMKSARELIEQIEVWRLEYGRPNGEPRSLEVESESAQELGGTSCPVQAY